jgi:gliding motility-associated lipoprotein GldH
MTAYKHLLANLFLCFILISCTQKQEVFYEFHSFPKARWDQREAIRFEVPVRDISQVYNVSIELRNSNEYLYKNIWLFVDYQTPEGKVRSDTLATDLADEYGRWYGRGISLYSCSFPYEQNVQYPDTGVYVYTIRQGMREDPLEGLSDVGLRISKKSE